MVLAVAVLLASFAAASPAGAVGDTFSVVAEQTTVTAGTPFRVTVTALDASGQPASYTGTVHFMSTDPMAVLPPATQITNSQQFFITLNTMGPQTITVSDSTVPPTTGSTMVMVQPGSPNPAASFQVNAPPTAAPGVMFSVQVTALDTNGRPVTSYAGTVHFSSSDPKASVPTNYTFQPTDQGTKTVTFTLNTGGDQTVTATDTSNARVTGQALVAVSTGPPAHFMVTAPQQSIAGMPFTVTVTAQDASGATVTTYTGTVKFSSTDTAAVLPPQTTFASSDNGTRNFSVTLNTPGGQTITVMDVNNNAIAGSTAVANSGSGTGTKSVVRLAGADRYATAAAISQSEFPIAHSASAVVVARGDQFSPDALVGGPLAHAMRGPVLLTPQDSVDASTKTEISRVLSSSGTILVMGGPAAISDNVVATLNAQGFTVVREAGPDRYATAVKTANALHDPPAVLLATGLNFPDALTAGAAAAHNNAAILLTADNVMPGETQAYLSAHSSDMVSAVGGQAHAADPSAKAYFGNDRYETATAVATNFFTGPTVVGIASGDDGHYADALGGGVHSSSFGGPLLLSPIYSLPPSTDNYLHGEKATINSAYLYGGTTALSDNVATQVKAAIS